MGFYHSRIQHGVGQGSFHSATVTAQRAGERLYRFDYVYDCGGLSGHQPITRSINRISLSARHGRGPKPVLDALVLSHYDQDHINWMFELARRFRVERIFVPHLGIDELLLVVAANASAISSDVLQELHALAHGSGSLAGASVTQVQRGKRNGGNYADGRPGQAEPNDPPDAGRDPARDQEGVAFPPSVTVGETGEAPGATMSDEDEVRIATAGPRVNRNIWLLRFWNRGISDELVALVRDALGDIKFPLTELGDPSGFSALFRWLKVRANREATVAAYGRAIDLHQPTWIDETSGKSLANFLSLGMYAGPPQELRRELFRYRRLHSSDGIQRDSACEYQLHNTQHFNEVGWLGTGDAPLGEPGVWSDFSLHFQNELPLTLTILLPHHGAAPRGGPRFYNPGLNHQSDVVSVISVGTTNNHGHPMPDVLGRILQQGGDLQIVTEKSILGFQEVVWSAHV